MDLIFLLLDYFFFRRIENIDNFDINVYEAVPVPDQQVLNPVHGPNNPPQVAIPQDILNPPQGPDEQANPNPPPPPSHFWGYNILSKIGGFIGSTVFSGLCSGLEWIFRWLFGF